MVYILILNWNGWADTIECLESVFHNDYAKFRVIIADNDSQDGSLEHIKAWADGRLDVLVNKNNPLLSYIFPPVPKPISYVEYDYKYCSKGFVAADKNKDLILIRTGANLGFAGGNNIGLKYALTNDDIEYVWLLNNDTVIKYDALSQLVLRMENSVKVGMIGSTLCYYSNPKIIQALGGAEYNKWFGTSHHVGGHSNISTLVDIKENNLHLDYIVGASILVPKPFLVNVGLMSEDYFLYYEELDWAIRGKKIGWKLAYAKNSVVFHKEKKSIGSNSDGSERSEISDFYNLRNRFIITRKYFPYYIISVYLSFIIVIYKRIRRGQIGRLWRFISRKHKHP